MIGTWILYMGAAWLAFCLGFMAGFAVGKTEVMPPEYPELKKPEEVLYRIKERRNDV